jgi:Fe-S-cluster-containing dehydrogenase component
MEFNMEEGVAEKCHLCHHWIDRGEKHACIDKCVGRYIYFGEIDEQPNLLNHGLKMFFKLR